ncbi:MAG: hypothetical protein WCX28_10750 [Bacteriovoracaceae bacterium]
MFIFLFGCKNEGSTEPHSTVNSTSGTGSALIHSTPSGATITYDISLTGKITPDTGANCCIG